MNQPIDVPLNMQILGVVIELMIWARRNGSLSATIAAGCLAHDLRQLSVDPSDRAAKRQVMIGVNILERVAHG